MAKKGNNEGSIYKDKQGRWRGVVSLPTADNKVKKKYFYGKTKKEVSEKVNIVLSQLRTNTYIEPCKITLYSWLCTWLETYCKNEVRFTTYINYETAVFLDMIPKNPVDYVVIPKNTKKEMRYFTVEEQQQLQSALVGERLVFSVPLF